MAVSTSVCRLIIEKHCTTRSVKSTHGTCHIDTNITWFQYGHLWCTHVGCGGRINLETLPRSNNIFNPIFSIGDTCICPHCDVTRGPPNITSCHCVTTNDINVSSDSKSLRWICIWNTNIPIWCNSTSAFSLASAPRTWLRRSQRQSKLKKQFLS